MVSLQVTVTKEKYILKAVGAKVSSTVKCLRDYLRKSQFHELLTIISTFLRIKAVTRKEKESTATLVR